LLDKLGAPAAPAPGENKPTEKPTAEKPPVEKPPGEKVPPPKPPAEETTGSILKRANKLAENGNCDGAMPLFRKVLDDNPSSVEALTGLGFCHLDRKEYASAHTRFRAALGISSHYQDAMWGIAELYQRQGNKEEAIAKYQEFLDAFPTSKRSTAARRQIDKLRADSGESSGGGGTSSGEESSPPPDPQVDDSP
jgi:Tfp pilus assembly protein PilF